MCNTTEAIKIGDGVHIGAGCTIIPNFIVGKWSIIGSGANVINNIPPYTTDVGIHSKIIKVNQMTSEVK